MKRLKTALMVTCGIGMLMCTSVLAEEETETETEFEVGTRMNPYEFDEEIDFGMYRYNDEYVDMTFTIDGYVKPEDVIGTYEDGFLIFEDDYIYIKGTIKTGSGYSDNESIYTYICGKMYSTDQSEYWADIYLYDKDTNVKIDSSTFTHSEYTFIVACYGVEYLSIDDMTYLKLYYVSDDDYAVWIDVSKMDYVDNTIEPTTK